MKVGIIQMERFGDLVIALPIAAWYVKQGHSVYWPVRKEYYASIQAAAPAINFIPFDYEPYAANPDPIDFLYNLPLAHLKSIGCDLMLPLYSMLGGADFIDEALLAPLKFDEYKYAYAGVPFSEKWSLSLSRDLDREKKLYDMLAIEKPYICVRSNTSELSLKIDLPNAWLENFQIIKIEQITNNIFDWIYTLEKASKIVMVDSCFSNIVEQLNINCEKYLIVRSLTQATPVYKNGWYFSALADPVIDRTL